MRTGNGSFRSALRSLTFILLCASTLLAEGAYHVIKKIPIAGDGGWDYVAADSEGHIIPSAIAGNGNLFYYVIGALCQQR